jgi:hypothetical protein
MKNSLRISRCLISFHVLRRFDAFEGTLWKPIRELEQIRKRVDDKFGEKSRRSTRVQKQGNPRRKGFGRGNKQAILGDIIHQFCLEGESI